MKNIFKQLEGWVTKLKANNFKKAVIHLTVYYSLGVFIILLISNVFVYGLFSNDLNLSYLLEQEESEAEHEILEKNELLEEQIKGDLFEIILFSDIFLTIIIVIIGYILSKKTLRPLEESYKLQKRFVANAAHELRTPLAVMKASFEVLLNTNRSSEEYQTYIQESQEEIDRLISLSNELLFLVQNENVQRKAKMLFPLSEVCTKKIQQIQAYAQTKNISIESHIERDISIVGYPDDISRLILNLIKNAIDYNIDQGKVLITVKKYKTQAHIVIQDTGIGIDTKDIPYVFDRFYKADNARTHTKVSGTGLGLSIVQEIVDGHDGIITLESSVGKGTKITIKFPLG